MTSYHGGKQKFGKEIAYEIFLNSTDRNIEIKGYAAKYGKIFDSEKVIDKLSIMGKKFKDVEFKYDNILI